LFTFAQVTERDSAYTLRLTNSGYGGFFRHAGQPALQDYSDDAYSAKAKHADPFHAA
jgi:hypothetical protein